MLLEVCVDSFQSALNAKNGGADRLELCSNLIIGGTTPSFELLKKIKKNIEIMVNVLIRPRFGDFLYDNYEFEIICGEIKAAKSLGADGVAIGALNPDGSLDLEKMEMMMAAASGMSVTLHRAFDMSADIFETLENAKKLGVNTILTSGGYNNAEDAMDILRQLDEKSGYVDIMAGSGINAEVIGNFMKKTEIKSFHMSGKSEKLSNMIYRNKKLSMGLPMMSEYIIWECDESRIAKAKNIMLGGNDV